MFRIKNSKFSGYSVYKKANIMRDFQICISRGVARDFLEGGLKSSKMSATMVGRRRGFWDVERLKWYISDSFQ